MSSWSHRSSCHISLVCTSRRCQACIAHRGRDWQRHETKGQRSTNGYHASSCDCMGVIEESNTLHLPVSTAYQQTRSSIDTRASAGHPTGMSTKTQSPQHGGTPNDPCDASMLNNILLARSASKHWDKSIAFSPALQCRRALPAQCQEQRISSPQPEFKESPPGADCARAHTGINMACVWSGSNSSLLETHAEVTKTEKLAEGRRKPQTQQPHLSHKQPCRATRHKPRFDILRPHNY